MNFYISMLLMIGIVVAFFYALSLFSPSDAIAGANPLTPKTQFGFWLRVVACVAIFLLILWSYII